MNQTNTISFLDFPAIELGQKLANEQLAMMGAHHFAREFGTFGLLLPRQCGKTRRVAAEAQQGDWVVHINQNAMNWAKKDNGYRPGVNHLSAGQDIGSFFRGKQLARSQFITFWFDEMTADQFVKLRTELVSYLTLLRDVDMTRVRFVLLTSMI